MTTNEPQKDSQIVILSSGQTYGQADRIVQGLNRTDQSPVRYSHLKGEFKTFPNGELSVHIPVTIRSKDVYFIHSPYHPDPNTGLMQMLLTSNAVRLASARSLTVIMLYLPYLRQDRKDRTRVPISAKVIASLIEANPVVKRIVTMDMHAEQEEGFFNIPVDNLRGRVLFADYYMKHRAIDIANVMVVAPDFGGAVRARRFAKLLGDHVPVGIIQKERLSSENVVMHNFIGEDPRGKFVILFDDIIDTAGSTLACVDALLKLGVAHVEICATHAVFSSAKGSTAEAKLQSAGIHVIVTDSIPRSESYRRANSSWLTVLSVESLLIKVLEQSDDPGGSVSSLF